MSKHVSTHSIGSISIISTNNTIAIHTSFSGIAMESQDIRLGNGRQGTYHLYLQIYIHMVYFSFHVGVVGKQE